MCFHQHKVWIELWALSKSNILLKCREDVYVLNWNWELVLQERSLIAKGSQHTFGDSRNPKF